MRRRFIVLTLLPAGVALAITAAVATPALAKGATKASITGPGLARPLTVSVAGEALPGLGDPLSTLAGQTGLFTVLFGSGSGPPDAPSALRTPPAAASLGPQYTVTYTVPGVTQGPGQAVGQIRQDLYPRAAGGPVIFTPPGQQGFGEPLQASGWLRATPWLTATLTRLGVPAVTSLPSAPRPAATATGAAPKPAGATAPAWLIATIVAAVAVAIVGLVVWRCRRSRPATERPGTPIGKKDIALARAADRGASRACHEDSGSLCLPWDAQRSAIPARTGARSHSRMVMPSWASDGRSCGGPGHEPGLSRLPPPGHAT